MKFFNKDSLWLTISNIVKLIFGMMVVPVIARNVGSGQLGALDLLLAYGPFINQLISMGLTNSSTKFYKDNNDDAIIKYMQSKIWIRSLVYTVIFFFAFNHLFAAKLHIPTLIVALYAISVFLENISFLPQNHFLNENDFKKYAILTALQTIIRHCLTLFLVLFIEDKLFGLSLGLLVSNIYLVWVNIKHHKSLIKFNFSKISIDKDVTLAIKKYSRPLFILGIVSLLYQSSDRLLLSYFTSDNLVQIGYLGMAQRIVGMLTISLSGLFTVWGVRAFDKYDNSILIREKEKLIGMMLVILAAIIFGMYLCKPLIIDYLLTQAYENSFSITIVLIATFVNNRIREILEKYFFKQGETKFIASVFFIFGIFSFVSSALALYFFDLQTMLIFRLIIAFLHAFTLFLFLRKAQQKLNPGLMIINLSFSILVVIFLELGFL